jgi:hypothetical protein
MNEATGRLGRAVILRLDAGRPLTALSPTWAALAGLLVAGGLRLDQQTLMSGALLWLLVEPLLGGLWQLVSEYAPAGSAAIAQPGFGLEDTTPDAALLPFGRRGSLGQRLASGLRDTIGGWQEQGWPVVSFLLSIAIAVAIASTLGAVMGGVAAAMGILAIRLRWRSGALAAVLQAAYDMAIPWLMGMVVLGRVAEYGWRAYDNGLILAALYTLAYLAALALAHGARLPGVLALDAAQAAVLAIMLSRQEILAVWLFGLCLVGQLAAHPALLAGGTGAAYLRRCSAYVVVGMLIAAAVLSPAVTGG